MLLGKLTRDGRGYELPGVRSGGIGVAAAHDEPFRASTQRGRSAKDQRGRLDRVVPGVDDRGGWRREVVADALVQPAAGDIGDPDPLKRSCGSEWSGTW